MKRRTFLKQTSLISAGALLPSIPFVMSSCGPNEEPKFLEKYILRSFDKEQEECPNIVEDLKGDKWVFSLRRLPYPKESERISIFKFEEGWKEKPQFLDLEGQFESLHASANNKAYPAITWVSIENDAWEVNVSAFKGSSFTRPHVFKGLPGKSIDPSLFTARNGDRYICWEQYHEGTISVYFSKQQNEEWLAPIQISKEGESCMNPSLAADENGNIFICYGYTSKYHQNIEIARYNSNLEFVYTQPVAIGGPLENRVNINCKPNIAFDSWGKLWISYESNRFNSRLEDGDNHTGDRACAILYMEHDLIKSPNLENRWLFQGINDHNPTFITDKEGNLHLATICGGDYSGNVNWRYRLSSLISARTWTNPSIILDTEQKGDLVKPSLLVSNNQVELAGLKLQFFKHEQDLSKEKVRSQLLQLEISRLKYEKGEATSQDFTDSVQEELEPDLSSVRSISGRNHQGNIETEINGETYKLLFGNLHEHSNISICWPAGTDGTLHDDYRFGLHSESYDFLGITDHSKTITEVYWRKSLRLVDFYNSPEKFVSVPAIEWTLPNKRQYDDIAPGVGHYNVIFKNVEEAKKVVRNEDELFSAISPETNDSAKLWDKLHQLDLECLTIPHHVSDIEHPCDWEVHDSRYVKLVEIFQCRGNAEYPGCPRERNLLRHSPSPHHKTYVNHALKNKNYQLGFIASGDHNSMGVGLAGLWVKEFSQEGIFDALSNRRCFATTGDKIISTLRINSHFAGQKVVTNKVLNIEFKVKAVSQLCRIELLKESEVYKSWEITNGETEIFKSFTAEIEEDAYFYLRTTQLNDEMAWTSPIWVKLDQ